MLFAPLGGSQPGKRQKDEPDWTQVHHELRRPGVTLLLLWEEYRAVHPCGYALHVRYTGQRCGFPGQVGDPNGTLNPARPPRSRDWTRSGSGSAAI
jgi:hypothetical protein